MSWQWFSTYLLSLGIFLLWSLVVLFRAQLCIGRWFWIQQLTFHAVFVEQNEWGYYPTMITLLCLIFGQRCKDAIWMVFLQWTAALYVCKMTIRKTFVNWGFVVKRERKKETAVPPLHTVRSCVGHSVGCSVPLSLRRPSRHCCLHCLTHQASKTPSDIRRRMYRWESATSERQSVVVWHNNDIC